MALLWILSLLPIAVWGVHWYFNREVVWWEAAVGVGAALIVSTIGHVVIASGLLLPMDVETWSGAVDYAQYQPKWREFYKEAIYKQERYRSGTDSKGRATYSYRSVFSHYESRRRWHDAQWWVESDLGTFRIEADRYAAIVAAHGGEPIAVPGDRSTMETASRLDEGDPNDYRSSNVTGYVYPVTDTRRFENRLLKASTLYNFEPVPEAIAATLFEWPGDRDRFDTERLLGTASETWDRREWDQMNAVLGPEKKVNLIAVGFGPEHSTESARLLERYWNGGKKNDLVLCFGTAPDPWAYVFGWTEREAVKRLLENRLRDGTATIEEITELVRAEYELLDFEEKFEHVQVDVPTWFYVVFFIIMIGSQLWAHLYAHRNDESKGSFAYRPRYGRRGRRA